MSSLSELHPQRHTASPAEDERPVPTPADTPPFCGTGPWDGRLSVLWLWHAAVVAEYRKPVALLARCPDLDITLLIPRRWPERAGQMVQAEPLDPDPDDSGATPYRIIVGRTVFTGLYYLYMFPGLLYRLLRLRPKVIYCYEEAHTLMGAAVLLFRRLFMPESRVLLYAAQNIKKRYPIPFRIFERYCFRNADAILACGKLVARTLRSKGYTGDVRLVGLPTDMQAFSPSARLREEGRALLGVPASALVAGYAGKLVEEKGLRTLLSAFAEVACDFPAAQLVLAGGGPLRDELAASAASLGLADRVHLPGVIHNSSLPAFMNALDVFVLPSETRPNWREQFGRVAVEAMACGTPVIGSDSGEIPSVLGDAGLVFPEADVRALASDLRELFVSPERRAELGSAGRERALRLFSIERVAAQHYAIYRRLFE